MGTLCNDPIYKSFCIVKTLVNGSKYCGDVNSDNLPHGYGVLYASAQSIYSGEFNNGKKSGYGVEMYGLESIYSGTFDHNQRHGYGILTSTYGDKYIGEWKDGMQHGFAITIDDNGVNYMGLYHENEPVIPSPENTWKTIEKSIQKAFIAQHIATQKQEIARTQEIQATLNTITTIDTSTFHNEDEIHAFQAQEEEMIKKLEVESMLINSDISQQSNQLYYQETALKRKQQKLIQEMDKLHQEYIQIEKYIPLAKERQEEYKEAQDVLANLQKELQLLQKH